MGPLADLRATDPNLRVSIVDRIDWTLLALHDAVFMHRPRTTDHLLIMDLAHAIGVPVWIDYDDHVFAVPPDNPSAKAWNTPEVQKCVAQIIAKADIVTVSSEVLARDLASLCQAPPRIIPNAHNARMFGNLAQAPSDNPLVMWRGSETHMRDVMSCGAEIIYNGQKHLDWAWLFLGMHPWFVTDRMPHEKTCVAPGMDPLEYFTLLRSLRPKVLIVPLADNTFNHAKSNIAWLEATYAGAICLAPNFPEWRRPGVITYDEPSDFEALLDAILSGGVDLVKTWELSRAAVEENLMLPTVNKMRLRVLEDLITLGADPTWKSQVAKNQWVQNGQAAKLFESVRGATGQRRPAAQAEVSLGPED